MTARILAAVVIGLLGFAACWLLAGWVNRLNHPAPTVPEEPDVRDDQEERPASGADEQYPHDLAADADRERELRAIADEYDLTLISPVGLMIAEDILSLRLNLAKLVDHFADRFNRIVDDFAPGWWEETAAVPLPDFGAVHALIDDTSEYRMVTT
jgi:hypothetical protein